jgi:hypothetical protein
VFVFFFSAYSSFCGMQNGHSSISDKNPRLAYWRAADDFLSGDSGRIFGAQAVSQNSHWDFPVAA